MVEAPRRITAASHCADDAAMVRILRRRWALACCARRTLAFLHPSADAARHARPDHAIRGQHGARPALPRLLGPARRVVHVRRGSRPACSLCSSRLAAANLPHPRALQLRNSAAFCPQQRRSHSAPNRMNSDCDRQEWPQACSEYRPPLAPVLVLRSVATG